MLKGGIHDGVTEYGVRNSEEPFGELPKRSRRREVGVGGRGPKPSEISAENATTPVTTFQQISSKGCSAHFNSLDEEL